MLQPAQLTFTAEGTPYSRVFGDVYHAAEGGPAQAQHVFLAGNGLPERWQGQERFVILETGFGLGLNFLSTWSAWRKDPARCTRLHFISLEKHPVTPADLQRAQSAWPEYAELAAELQAQWPPLCSGVHRLSLNQGQVILTLFFGDAVDTLRTVDAAVDAFFLDGFSPAKNPELWTPQFCRGLTRLSSLNTTLSTWSVAGHLREALEAAEFNLEKRPGFGGKREMLVGRFRSARPLRHHAPKERRALIIGAGVAGCSTAHRLAERGWQVTLLEAADGPAQGASLNLAGLYRPLPSADDNPLSRLTRAGFLALKGLLAQLPGVLSAPCGVVQLARDAEHERQQQQTVEKLGLPPELLQFLDAATLSTHLGYPVQQGGWWFPEGGWLQPGSLCRAVLAAWPDQIEARFACTVDRIEKVNSIWQAVDQNGAVLASAPVLIIAAGVGARRFAPLADLPQLAARGQVSHVPAEYLPPLRHVVCRQGYVIPPLDGLCVVGATHSLDDDRPNLRLADHLANMAQLERNLPGATQAISSNLRAKLDGRVGFRPMSPDHLPIVGPVPELDDQGRRQNLRPGQRPREPHSLWCVQGFGARGIVWSALMADVLVSQLEGDPLPLEMDLVNAIAPARFFTAPSR